MGLFSAIGGIVGGLFGGGKSGGKTTTESVVDYEAMARRAQKAGFNPLTALRNGGAAGFSSTTTSHPGLSGIGEVVSQIGGYMGAALDERIDPIQQQTNHAEQNLVNLQLAQTQDRLMPVPRFGDVPARTGNPRFRQAAPPLASPAALGKNGSAIPKTQLESGDAPTVSSVGLEDRFGITPDPKTADAAAWEQRYAEPGEWVGGVYTMGADAIYNAKQALLRSGIDVDKVPTPNELGQKARDWLNAPLASDSYANQAARWIDEQLGTTKPKVVKGGRLVPKTSW